MHDKKRCTEDGLSLLEMVLSMRPGSSLSKGRKWIKAGQVTIEGLPNKIPSTVLKSGQLIEIHFEVAAGPGGLKAPYTVLYEDKFICIFEKPDGVPAAKSGPKFKSASDRMIDYLRSKYGDEVFTVLSRLDKRESGLMVIAIGLKTLRVIEESRSEIEFRSYAITEGVPGKKEGVWEHRLSPNTIGLLKLTRSEKGRDCKTAYSVMNAGSGYALLKLSPDEAFKGQLRAQCSIAGYPIAGDKRYGARSNPLQRTCLHLFSVRMKHPFKEEMIEAKTRVPREFLQIVKA